MRINILIAGGLILAVSILLVNSEFVTFIFGFAFGVLNVLVGILTPKSVGITVPPSDYLGPLKLWLDKGVIRTTFTLSLSSKRS